MSKWAFKTHFAISAWVSTTWVIFNKHRNERFHSISQSRVRNCLCNMYQQMKKKWFATMSFLYSTLQAFYSLTIFSSFLISRISVLFMLSICAEFEIHSLFSPPYGWNMVLYEMWAELKEIPQRRQVWLELSCSMMLRVDQPLVPQETSIKAECSKWLVVERV